MQVNSNYQQRLVPNCVPFPFTPFKCFSAPWLSISVPNRLAGDSIRRTMESKWWEYANTVPVQDVETWAGFADVDYGFSSHPVSEAQPRAFRSGCDGDGRVRKRISRRSAVCRAGNAGGN